MKREIQNPHNIMSRISTKHYPVIRTKSTDMDPNGPHTISIHMTAKDSSDKGANIMLTPEEWLVLTENNGSSHRRILHYVDYLQDNDVLDILAVMEDDSLLSLTAKRIFMYIAITYKIDVNIRPWYTGTDKRLYELEIRPFEDMPLMMTPIHNCEDIMASFNFGDMLINAVDTFEGGMPDHSADLKLFVEYVNILRDMAKTSSISDSEYDEEEEYDG